MQRPGRHGGLSRRESRDYGSEEAICRGSEGAIGFFMLIPRLQGPEHDSPCHTVIGAGGVR